MRRSDHENRMALTNPLFLLRLAAIVAMVLGCVLFSRAGGPKCVAGTSYFDSTMTGQPLLWPQGIVPYYTDQGDLSPILPNASANSFVASAFSQWTSVTTAAVAATSGGQLAEDINGTNVVVNANGTISMPSDIQSTATTTPVGIVYDQDGAVTDALLGAGAGGSGQCFTNAVFGGNDNYGSFGTYQHALIVINGVCAQQSSQLTDVEYRLVRVIGGVLGLGWSQLNLNVQTGSPTPTSDDYAGFPVMHFSDSLTCAPITRCYANPYGISMDDAAAISRLYPVTSQNISSFPGKQVFSSVTARIHGSVWFTDAHGSPTQPMQGVNVIARYIDPTTGIPSRRYAESSVSGFLFTGNSGNSITGFDDSIGDPFSEWGSNNQSTEGFFDLAGLQLPNGTNAQYQISVEGVDPRWSPGVGPYSPGPVAPSGSFQPVIITVTAGGDVAQDIIMAGSAQPLPQASSSWTAPAPLPVAGDWVSSLNGYSDNSYFSLKAQGNRTLSVAVTALDESGRASENKAQPVVGMWAASDPQGTPPPTFTPSPFNQTIFGMTRLDTQVLVPGSYLLGISDLRGDGRPDYRYHAHVLYADTVTPSRVSVNGGAVTVQGIGFSSAVTSTIGAAKAAQLAASTSQLAISAPTHSDGLQNITITDPSSGSSTTMTGALTYGAAATDNIVLLYGINPTTPVGAQAAHPVSVRVLAADEVTPVSGATIGWSATNALQLSVCSGASSCSAVTDQNGDAATWLNPGAVGVATVTATLAPGVYSSSKSVNASINATETSSDIGVASPFLYVSQGATANVPLTVRALSNGAPKKNVQVNFNLVAGSGTLSSASAQTSAAGYATVTLAVAQFAALAQVTACVAPANSPCGTFYVNPVSTSQQRLLQIAGAGQISTGSAFQPVVVEVTDLSTPPNPVIAAPIVFQTTVLRPGGTSSTGGNGDLNPGNPSMPVILQVSQTSTITDANGLATIAPSSSGFSAPLEVNVSISAGIAGFLDDTLEAFPPTDGSTLLGPKLPSFLRRPVSEFR